MQIQPTPEFPSPAVFSRETRTISRVITLSAIASLLSTLTFAAVLAFPAFSQAQPTMTWGRAVHDAHIIVGKWMDGQSSDWSNLTGIQATGRDCYRANQRTFYCTISFTGTYTNSYYGVSQDEQAYALVRMYLLANGYDLYSQVGPLSLVAISAPYFTGDVARKHQPAGHALAPKASAAVAGKVSG